MSYYAGYADTSTGCPVTPDDPSIQEEIDALKDELRREQRHLDDRMEYLCGLVNNARDGAEDYAGMDDAAYDVAFKSHDCDSLRQRIGKLEAML